MILVKKTAVLSQRGVQGISGVARFECFKDKSDVKINLTGKRKDLYAVVAVGDEKKVVRLSGDRIYLTRADLSGDCAALIADGDCRVLCAGATATGYDFTPLEKFLPAAIGIDKKESEREEKNETAQENEKNNFTIVNPEPVQTSLQLKTEETEEKKPEMKTEKPIESSDVTSDENHAKENGVEKDFKTDAVNEYSGDMPHRDTENAKPDGSARKNKDRFFDKIESKIEKLFEENESDSELNALIPDSRWARVNTDDGWYVVGIVGEPAEFICYGIPADNPSDPPEEDAGCRQWMEVERGGRGYWMMYQSAESGETLTAI